MVKTFSSSTAAAAATRGVKDGAVDGFPATGAVRDGTTVMSARVVY